jgi:hypothetical protein
MTIPLSLDGQMDLFAVSRKASILRSGKLRMLTEGQLLPSTSMATIFSQEVKRVQSESGQELIESCSSSLMTKNETL